MIFLFPFLLSLSIGLPIFPNDWTAIESMEVAIHQGDYSVIGDSVCCPLDSPNCKVQIQSQSGKHYYDYTHNRTRMDYDTGEIIVNDYNIGKEMDVVISATGTFQCSQYCPLQFGLDPLSVDPTAKDKGAIKIAGKEYEKWDWKEVILKIIVMERIEMLVDQSGSPAIPFSMHEELTPFGQDIGSSNTNYTDFLAGTPDPMLFKVENTTTCPMSPNCDQTRRQMLRLSDGNRELFWHYYNKLHL